MHYCVSVVCCFVVFVLGVFLFFFWAGLYGVVWFSFRLWTVSVPLKLCSVPDILNATGGEGDVAWSMTTLHDPAGIQANR